jgi:glycosyltransferase involved in cell wall biosynthesis
LRAFLGALRGEIDGVTPETQRLLLARIASEQIDTLFLNGSNLGRLAKTVKIHNPTVEILTFFHNVEARFFLGALSHGISPRSIVVLIANFISERLAVRFSDRLITLNERDSDGLRRLYGRPATDLLPMAITDQTGESLDDKKCPIDREYLLFVGGGFYANRAGISWFAKQVAPEIDTTICVVGHGLDDLRDELDRHPNMRLIGAVDDLAPWYRGAKAVIAPIFDGSGMKTKVAEALMHGKRIAATSFALAGYNEVASQVGWVCDTKEAFIAAIRDIERTEIPPFDPTMRSLYERHYSIEATKIRLAAILG